MKPVWDSNMVSKVYLLFLLTICTISYSQSRCYNSDFSAGNFTGWTGYTGTFSDPGLVEGISSEEFERHKIITAPYQDVLTCEGLSSIPPGESYSARLGNPSSGAEAEKLVFNVSVTEDTSLFIYKYAVVLQDPGHSSDAQPRFSMRILDSNGAVINPTCGVYDVYAGQANQNFISCSEYGVAWLPWKTIGINLTPYIGQNLSIEFETRDCSAGGHFGYAYISAKCAPLKINIKFCTDGNNFTLMAPAGFASYTWSYQGQTIGNTQNLILSLDDYPIGSVFDCKMIAYSNGNLCEVTIQGTLTERTVINPGFSFTSSCNNNLEHLIPVNFYNQSIITNGTLGESHWDFGDGTSSTQENPSHAFTTPGTYTVSLTVISDGGCSATISQNVIIGTNTLPEPNIGNQSICFSPGLTLSDLNTNGQNVLWFDSAIATTPLSLTQTLTSTTYYCSQIFNGCPGPRKPIVVSIIQVPLPQGNNLQTFCGSDAPTVSDLVFNGTGIKWYSSETSSTPLPGTDPLIEGTYYVTQTNSTGCESTRRPVYVYINGLTSVLPENYSLKFCQEKKPTLKDLSISQTEVVFYESMHSTTPLPENFIITADSNYYVSVVDPVTGCESIERFIISVKLIACEIEVYNNITINNNNLNDYLAIKNIERFPDNTVEVYNRYGQLVYKANNYGTDNNLFKGIANAGEVFQKNEKLPTGTYYYIVSYSNRELGINVSKKGFLYITNNE